MTASADLRVMSLMENPTGHLSNLSTGPDLSLPVPLGDGEHLFMFPSTTNARWQGFARVVNRDIFTNLAIVDGHYGPERRTTSFEFGVNRAVHFNSNHLAQGKPALGLAPLGAAEGPWWLRIIGGEAIHGFAYIRTADGFLTAMHDMAPYHYNAGDEDRGGRHDVVIFNPASNTERRSLLRLVNPHPEAEAKVTITGIDDAGESPGDPVRLTLPGSSARMLSAEDLESGVAEGLEGALGDGEGKWRLIVESAPLIAVMSLLDSAASGHLTNLSTGTLARRVYEPVLDG